MGEYRPKQVELIEIINKPLLLHLVGYLYYWQVGFNSVFKGLTWANYYCHLRISRLALSVLIRTSTNLVIEQAGLYVL